MGKRFENAKKEIDVTKAYTAEEAIELAKKTSTTKFVGNIEAHIRLGIDAKKSDQIVRTTVKFPHATGKIKRIAAFVTEGKEKEAKDAGAVIVGGEDLIKKIKENESLNFDIAVAEPAMMPKLAQIAKILGPRGLMPNPKTGTVSADIGKAIKEYAAGKTELKNDESGNVHITLGKSNLETKDLLDNFNTFLEAVTTAKPTALKKEYIMAVTVHSTMGPGIKVKI